MFAKALVSIATVSAFLGVFSQSPPLPTSPAQLTPCILNCTEFGLAKSTCTSILDFQCLCTSSAFQIATGQCLNTTCDAADIQTANSLQGVECANFTNTNGNNGNNGSASATGPTGPTSASTSAPTSAPTSAATGKSPAPTTSPSTTQTTPAGTNTNTSPPPSNAAGLAHQLTFGLSHIVGLTSAFAAVLAGFTILL